MRRHDVLLVSFTLVGLSLLHPAGAAKPEDAGHRDPIGILAAVQRELLPSERLIATSPRAYEIIGRDILRVKIVDDATGTIRELTLDQKNGRPVAHEHVRTLATSHWRRQHGAASRDLVRRLTESAGSLLTVDVEVASVSDIPAWLKELESSGMRLLATHRNVVTVQGNPEQILAVSRTSGVASVGEHHERRNLSLGIAADLDQPAIRTAHRTGAGVGFVAAVWEPGACIRRDHPDFARLTFEPRFRRACSVFDQAGHSTKVAGVLAADRGASGTAGLFRGRLFDVDARDSAAEDDMWERAPEIVNASFTISRLLGREIDRKVYEKGIFVFNGSANDERDEANCYAFNALCVGAYHDGDTIGVFRDDQVSLGHSYLNDKVNGREYPQVVGPVLARKTAGPGALYVTESGTSFATPGVAGLAALMLAHQPFSLFNRPALVRAILMASAQAHPVKHEGPSVPVPTDNIDDRAGVGAPNGRRAREIIDGRTFVFKAVTPASLGRQASFPIEKNERVRVVLVWDQCPEYDPYDAELTADLDLAVKVPNHLGAPFPKTVTHTNASFADNWEAVEFIALVSGTAEIVVSAARFGTCAMESNRARAPMAVAWTKEPASPVVGR
jgi:hypothetical protein